jgi:uncharacterized protein
MNAVLLDLSKGLTLREGVGGNVPHLERFILEGRCRAGTGPAYKKDLPSGRSARRERPTLLKNFLTCVSIGILICLIRFIGYNNKQYVSLSEGIPILSRTENPRFSQKTVIDASQTTVFTWHEREGAFLRLNPPWEKVRVLEAPQNLHDGSIAKIKVWMDFFWMLWVLEHQNYQANHQFEDLMRRGPFSYWCHTHKVTALGPKQSILEDSIVFKLPMDTLVYPLARWVIEPKLKRMFAYRHRISKNECEHYQQYEGGPCALKILISGASGLVGEALCSFLSTQGHTVHTLVRHKQHLNPTQIFWNPDLDLLDSQSLEGFDAVIHLAGENIATGRWDARKKQAIEQSRIKGTALLANVLAGLQHKPSTFITASAIGFYGDRGAEIMEETSGPGLGFLPAVCQKWEQSSHVARQAGIRTVNMRLGIVLTPKGGALQKMLPPFLLGAGGPLGSGEQYMSWIALEDVVGAFHHAVLTETLSGPVNVVSPNPVTNAEFTQNLGRVLWRPAFLPAPALALRLLLGEMAEALLLASTRVRCNRLLDSGYRFTYPVLEPALRHMLGK